MKLTILECFFSNFATYVFHVFQNCCESVSPRQKEGKIYGLFSSWCCFYHMLLCPFSIMCWCPHISSCEIYLLYPVKPVVLGVVGRLHSIASLISVLSLLCRCKLPASKSEEHLLSCLHPTRCWTSCLSASYMYPFFFSVSTQVAKPFPNFILVPI